MDAFDLANVRKRIAQLIAAQATDVRVLESLRHEDGLIPQETELWDYKTELGDDAVSLASAVMHIVSFYNTYGGYLLYGVAKGTATGPMAITGAKRQPNQQQLRDLVRAYTGHSIPVTVGVTSINEVKAQVCIVCVPKRRLDEPPIIFGKNGPDHKPGKPLFTNDTAYFRDMDQSVPIRSRDQWALVFGRRSNPNLWELNQESAETPTLDNTLPDQNIIFPWFIGRATILTELWRWLGNPFAYLKLLAGDGGKGKTSIAYEFGRQVCTSAPLGFERVLWLSAKRERFVGQLDAYVPMPEAHFSDTASFLQRLADQCAVTTTEAQGASESFLKTLIREALVLIPSLIIVDDVDSLEVDQQKTLLSTLQQLSCHKGRFLITTRMNFSFAPDMAITVGGLERDDYGEFVSRMSLQFGVDLGGRNASALYAVTEGSPLFTESLLRLARQGMTIEMAVDGWKGKLGAEARNAALMKEISNLSAPSRRVLLACAFLERASLSELKNVVEYVDQRMRDCIAELQAMFLLAEPQFIEGEHRFSVSYNTQSLVIENAAELSNDPQTIQRRARQLLRLRRGATNVRSVGLAISQAVAILRDDRFGEAIATLEAALETEPDNVDLLSTLALCLLVEGRETENPRKVEEARDRLRRSYKLGQRKAKTFELWFECESLLLDWGGAEEVCGLAVRNGTEPRADWLRRRATTQVALAEGQARGATDLAARKLEEAATDLAAAVDVAVEGEKVGFEKLLADVHDRQWTLVRQKGSGIAELKLAVDTVRRFVERGDLRGENGARLVETLDRLLVTTRAQRTRRRGFKNLADQIARQVEVSVRRMGDRLGEPDVWRPLLETAGQLRQKLNHELGLDAVQ